MKDQSIKTSNPGPNRERRPVIKASLGIVFGAILGLILGNMLGSMAWGLILGAGIGLARGSAADQRRKRQNKGAAE